METKEQIIENLKRYVVNVLEPSRPELFGFPACPFIKSERLKNNIMYDVLDDRKFLDLVREFDSSDYTTAVFAQPLPEGESMSHDEANQYQIFINAVMKENGFGHYKNICISPEQTLHVEGFSPRAEAPYVLINIGNREDFERTHESIKNTKYFENFPDEYMNYLVRKEKKC